MADSESKSVTAAKASGPVSAAKPSGDPRDAELESLRRLLGERDGQLAEASQQIAELKESSVTRGELDDFKRQLETMRSQIPVVPAATAAAPVTQAPSGWEGALKAEGFTDRASAPTAGQLNPLPEGYMYRLTAPAVFPQGHPQEGQRCYKGVTCVHLPKKVTVLPGEVERPDYADRQYCIQFSQGIGLTDDREVAWAMANEYGYGLDVETKPVIKFEARDEDFKPILAPRAPARGAMQLKDSERAGVR